MPGRLTKIRGLVFGRKTVGHFSVVVFGGKRSNAAGVRAPKEIMIHVLEPARWELEFRIDEREAGPPRPAYSFIQSASVSRRFNPLRDASGVVRITGRFRTDEDHFMILIPACPFDLPEYPGDVFLGRRTCSQGTNIVNRTPSVTWAGLASSKLHDGFRGPLSGLAVPPVIQRFEVGLSCGIRALRDEPGRV